MSPLSLTVSHFFFASFASLSFIPVFPAPQFTLYNLPQDKGLCPLQPTPRFYFPPIPGTRPDSPYPVDGDSTITSVSDIPAVNDLSWNFAHDPTCPMSFMDLLGSPLVIYDHPTNIDDIHLPQPPIEPPAFPDQNLSVPNAANIDDIHLPQPTLELPAFLDQDLSVPKDVMAVSGQQVVVADTLCKRGINPPENMSVSLPTVPMEGHPEVPSEVGSMVLREVAMVKNQKNKC
ncbi:hypothetical protein BKA83DRAFT_4126717 [Pisolithus microcarpus]|nr:hypothetical protein BKA83DRAFT_4126717 [Pisolithus microcarpus]